MLITSVKVLGKYNLLMYMKEQTTINTPMSCYGITMHSGILVQLTLKPSKANTGIVFIRTDVKKNNYIFARYDTVSSTTFCTTIANEYKVSVSTIEHLMAAIWGQKIDNLIIELDGPEVPIMDGSSQPFLFLLECAGKKYLSEPRKYIKLRKDIELIDNNKYIYAKPADSFELNMNIDFEHQIIGKQSIVFKGEFKQDLAAARTFGFTKDIELLQKRGLALGASLNNAVGISDESIVNPEGLRFEDEFVRHKALDVIGDFFLIQGHLLASIDCGCNSHSFNNKFIRKIFSDQSNYEFVSR